MTSIIRTVFAFLIARAARSRLAALAAALLALLFSRHLMRAAHTPRREEFGGSARKRVFEGEFRRVD